jgi:hypothetical protein
MLANQYGGFGLTDTQAKATNSGDALILLEIEGRASGKLGARRVVSAN